MRIIAGKARGRTLIAPKGMNTRPTQDKVRESLFNILCRDVPDARVLDLFAGSGALGLEAVSRGAQSAVLVDSSREAMACIQKNIEAMRAQADVEALQCDYRQAMARLQAAGKHFDLVFIDPPYRMDNTGEMACQIHEHGLLGDGCILVIEHSASTAPVLSPPFAVYDVRTYGDTKITLVTMRGKDEEEADAYGDLPGKL